MSLPPTPIQIMSLFKGPYLEYYDAALNQELGPHFLVDRALTGNLLSYDSRSNSSTLYTILLTHLSSKMSIPDRDIFSSLLSFVAQNKGQIVLPSGKVDNPIFIPQVAGDIRQNLLEGSDSIQSNLPVPQTRVLDNRFVYVPLKETIKHQFATDTPPHPFLPFDKDEVHALSQRGRVLLGSFLQSDVNNDPNKPLLYHIKLILW